MQVLIPLVYDIILLLFLLMTMRKLYRRGFVSSIVMFLGYLASFIVSVFLSEVLSTAVYDAWIEKPVLNAVTETVSGFTNTEGSVQLITKITQTFPWPLNNMLYAAATSNPGAMEQLDQAIQNGPTTIATWANELVIAPIVTMILKAVFFFLIMLLAWFVVRSLARMFRGVNRIPLVGGVNALLGAVLGLIQGLLVVLVLCFVIRMIILLSGNSLSFMNDEVIQDTYLFQYLYRISPFV